MCADSAPWRRQSSQLSGGDTLSLTPTSGDRISVNVPPDFVAPVPPPPPPPGPGIVPTLRISTEIPDTKCINKGTQEPPAAIQNAMMTKDKKPFTYTPGGLDLSEIRSPRMQKRISRNANAEGVSREQQAVPRPPANAQGALPPSAVAVMQPQVAIPVFPPGSSIPKALQVPPLPPTQPSSDAMPPPPPPPPHVASSSSVPRTPPESGGKQSAASFQSAPSQPTTVAKFPTSSVPKGPVGWSAAGPVPSTQSMVQNNDQDSLIASPERMPVPVQNEPGSIYVPPVTISGNNARAQMGSLYIPPVTTAPNVLQQLHQQQQPGSPQSSLPQLQKAPAPWMSQKQRSQPMPPWAQKHEEETHKSSSEPSTRIIPIQVEGREPPKSSQPPLAEQTCAQNTRIIPIQLENGNDSTFVTPKTQQLQQQQLQQQVQNRKPAPVYVHNKFSPSSSNHVESSDNNSRQLQHQSSWGPGGPVQSRSFRVLQKITDTDHDETDSADSSELPGGQETSSHQLRKMQLSDDDLALMNKFKAQVDEETFLHNEPDPRYRGAAIPSRAFRMLQTMTDTVGDMGEQCYVPRGPGPVRGNHVRQSSGHQTGDDEGSNQQYIPPSEQQVQEPRKYTGGAIPSRSFKMLQALTAGSENCGPGQTNM